ncbi:uncharacterized protein LOC125892722 isoform X1 [Epinephelus fuscoguttatus]|uniref:uncharacterized protein LOC125892722 isoform X1 n=1 Tax=Epinephelus fuscoguttatus TaxID=293821 RepID=UPI0020CFF184|nr:uncharacterized protein LOC125892722 isoform X1 [Epinephelus fuscoguttatus]
MTHPVDYFFHSHPQSGQSAHTQESGDAGLSSNMEHSFTDYYNESSGPVADKGSFVMPIPKIEPDSFHYSVMVKKIWSQPSVLKHALYPKTRPVSAEEAFIKLPSQAVFQKPNFPPQDWSESSSEEKSDKVLKADILEKEPDAEVAGEERCTKMDTWGNPAKPKGPPVGPGSRRNGNQRRRRAAGRHWKLYLLCWVAFTCVPVSGGFPAKCFTCMDKDRCPKLLTIYETDQNNILFKRGLNNSLPECSVISPPGPMSCVVCQDQSNITIYCSEDVGKIDVEDIKGQIVDISPCCTKSGEAASPSPSPVNATDYMKQGDQKQIPDRARNGLIVGGVLFLIVVVALVIYIGCHRKQRTESRQ